MTPRPQWLPVSYSPHAATMQVEAGIGAGKSVLVELKSGTKGVNARVETNGAFFSCAGDAEFPGKKLVPNPPRTTMPCPIVAAKPIRGCNMSFWVGDIDCRTDAGLSGHQDLASGKNGRYRGIEIGDVVMFLFKRRENVVSEAQIQSEPVSTRQSSWTNSPISQSRYCGAINAIF